VPVMDPLPPPWLLFAWETKVASVPPATVFPFRSATLPAVSTTE